jgi:hypothetical protein
MRAFLEAYWKRGLRSDDGLASLLGNLSRGVWANRSTFDPAMWQDWREAVELIRNAPGGASVDPICGSRAEYALGISRHN